jgi:hypothetical protein
MVKTINNNETETKNLSSDLINGFQKAYHQTYYLERLEGAWEYYIGLNAEQRKELRNYHSHNGEIDFKILVYRIKTLLPDGIADRVGKKLLLEEIEAEVKSFSEEEKGLSEYLKVMLHNK